MTPELQGDCTYCANNSMGIEADRSAPSLGFQSQRAKGRAPSEAYLLPSEIDSNYWYVNRCILSSYRQKLLNIANSLAKIPMSGTAVYVFLSSLPLPK